MAADAVVGRREHGPVLLEEPPNGAWVEIGPVGEHDHRPCHVVPERGEPAAERGPGACLPVVALNDGNARAGLESSKVVRALDDDDLVDR